MYSTSIKDDRSFAKCLLIFPKKSVIYEKFVIDTGSKYTCCHYTVVDKALKEEWLCSSEIKLIGGIITDVILGMDILKQLIFISDPYDRRICFCKDRDDYHRNFRLAVN